jgi:hypothetical protein
MAKPYNASLMDSNWIHGPSGQNGFATPKMVLEISIFWWLWMTPILVKHKIGSIGKFISLTFRAYVECPKQRSYAI